MKIVSKIIGVFVVLATLASCSTVNVTDAWKDSRIQNIDGGKVLIMFRSKDDVARQRFEKDMAAQLKKKGTKFEVVPSYVNFPDAYPDEKHSPNEIRQIRERIKKKGIDIAVITTVKSINESVITSVNMDPGAYYGYGGYGGYGYYSGRYRRGYYHGINMSYVGSMNSTAITTTEKEFVVETVLYDLSLPEGEQLLAVVTSLVDNPKSLVTTSDDFAKAVVKQLFKKMR